MRRLARLSAVCLVVLGLTVPSVAPASAEVRTWTARVIAVNDGDTFDVDFDRDGVKDARVRMLGIQAMELRDYVRKVGDCHAREAFARLEQLIEGKTVRLSAANPASTGLKGRLQRFVSVKINGRWRDVGRKLLREGHALWFPSAEEPSRNASYLRAARKARAAGVGLWDRDYCGHGPTSTADLRLRVQWDADGVDADNVNGEWVRIRNDGIAPVPLGGWLLRESALRVTHSPTAPLRQYRFPAGTVVAPGSALTVHVGKGTDGPTRLYWGQSEPVFENAEDDGRNDGDGAYLFDPDGDLRFDFMYPCLGRACSDPAIGDLEVFDAVYDPKGEDTAAGESISLRIPAGSDALAVPLEDYLLETWPYSYAFGVGEVLRRGEVLTVIVGTGEDTPLRRHWGFRTSILKNTGDVARIRTYDNIVVHCHAWGTARC